MKTKYWSYCRSAVVAVMAFTAYSAHATTKVSIVGLGNAAKPVPTKTYSEKVGMGGGILIDTNVSKKGSVEYGFLYAPKIATFTTTNALRQNYTSTFTVPTLEIPLLYRIWPNRVLSFGFGVVGMVANKLIGDATIETKRGAARINNSVPVSGTGFAAAGSMKLLIPFSARFGLVADGRYLYGLSGAKWREIEGIVGFAFGNNVRN